MIIELGWWPDRDRQIKHLAAGEVLGEGQAPGGSRVAAHVRRRDLLGGLLHEYDQATA